MPEFATRDRGFIHGPTFGFGMINPRVEKFHQHDLRKGLKVKAKNRLKPLHNPCKARK